MTKLTILTDLTDLTNLIYDIANKFPHTEQYNLTSQIKRAMVSVRLNIREGNIFWNKKKLHFLLIAKGSLNEVDECIQIARERSFITNSEFELYEPLYWKVSNKLTKWIKFMRAV